MANGTIAFDTLSTSGQISGTARSIDTDYLLNGTSKCWFDTSGGSSPQGSFNVASMTDVGTGTYKPTFSNNMADGFYAIASICDLAGYVFLDTAQATTHCQLANRTDGSGDTDSTYMGVVIHGDLA
tara:strand:+ start:270 stop:647 length:378 start_codon:yes stop_codon:yes gene_type:complete